MHNILIAGATGYLGSHLVREIQYRKRPFRALARNQQKLEKMGLSPKEITIGEVTQPETLTGKLNGIDLVISTVGITRQKDGLTYMDVDFQANMNLLREAQRAGVRKFIYVSAIHGNQMKNLKIFAAKERFVDALQASGMDYMVVRPNGFFSDMKDFLDMAQKGRVYLFGSGAYKLNPIHGADLAEVILDSIYATDKELVVGGPDIYTQNEIAELALRAWEKPKRIVHLPDWMRKGLIIALRTFTPTQTHGPAEFFLSMMGRDNIAPRFGIHRLRQFFKEEADQIAPSS